MEIRFLTYFLVFPKDFWIQNVIIKIFNNSITQKFTVMRYLYFKLETVKWRKILERSSLAIFKKDYELNQIIALRKLQLFS